MNFLLIFLSICIRTTATDGIEEGSNDQTTDRLDTRSGLFIGDVCRDKCSYDLLHAFCSKESQTCECDKHHPIVLNKQTCLPPLSLGDLCNHVESCSYTEPNAICAEVSQYYYKCMCKDNYQLVTTNDGSKCTPVEKEQVSMPAELPTALGIGIGLGLFAALLCMVLRLFSNARFGQPRGHYAYAGPPVISLANATTAGPRRSSAPGSNPTCRRQSYSVLATANKPGSRRPSTGSIRSQTSVQSTNPRSHDQLRPTLSAPTTLVDPSSPSARSPNRRIPVFTNVVVEENDSIEATPEIQIVTSEPTEIPSQHIKV